MKKTIALLLCAASLFLLLAGCGRKEEQNITFTAVIEEIYDSSILVSTNDEVGFDKANVSFAPDISLCFNFLVGQTVRITILPQIRESYPVQVTAVTIELVSAPAASEADRAGYTASFFRADSRANEGWDIIIQRAENADTMVISSKRHIPVVRIDSPDALAEFLEAMSAYFQLDVAYDGNQSFADAVKTYDDAFFSDRLLLLLCTQETSGSIRHRIKDTPISGGGLSVVVEAIVPEIGTDDMADWFIMLELSREELAGCDKFDAYYG